jgi:hypothetical protein
MKYKAIASSREQRLRNLREERHWHSDMDRGPSYNSGILLHDLSNVADDFEYTCSLVRKLRHERAHRDAVAKISDPLKREALNKAFLCHTMKQELLPNMRGALKLAKGLKINIEDHLSSENPLLSPKMNAAQRRHYNMQRKRLSILDE